MLSKGQKGLFADAFIAVGVALIAVGAYKLLGSMGAARRWLMNPKLLHLRAIAGGRGCASAANFSELLPSGSGAVLN